MASETVDLILPRKGKNHDLHKFAEKMLEISKQIGFKVSSRGWCYQLEGFRVINKGEFDIVEKIINECRKKGILPIDFVADDTTRSIRNIDRIEDKTPAEIISNTIELILTMGDYHNLDYWDGEEYYIQLLVEKVDLVTLFEPICKKYHIPISNSRGWSSIMQRANLIKYFKKAQEKGAKLVLLYCGDHDPFGLAISDYLRKNLNDLQLATGFNADDLIIDRFGLNYDFIIENNLTWIDNLESGSKKKPDYKNPIVKEYISKYGERKVEANAIIVRPNQARELCENTILKYLGENILERYSEKEKEIKDKYDSLMEETNIKEPLTEALDLLKDYIPSESDDEYDDYEDEDDFY